MAKLRGQCIPLWLLTVQLRNIFDENGTQSSVAMVTVTQTMKNNCEYNNLLYLCDNKNCIGNPYKLRSLRQPPLRTDRRTIIILMLLLCGDVELNPGPVVEDTFYPCGFCGFMIAVHRDLDVVVIELCENTAETMWVKLLLKGEKPILLGCFYRTNSTHTPAQVEELEKVIHHIQQNHNWNSKCTILLGGEFNLLYIDWKTESLDPKCNNVKM